MLFWGIFFSGKFAKSMVYLAILSLVLLGLLIYFDLQHRKQMREKDQFIKDLELKFLSRDVGEYKEATRPEPEEGVVEENPYVPLEDVPIDKLLEAKDEL